MEHNYKVGDKIIFIEDTFDKAYIDSETGWYNVTRFKKES